METRTRPSRPMLPVTSAPAAETLPSVTVSVERVEGSHAPALVTIVTFQSPSYGVWAVAGAAASAAVAVVVGKSKIVRFGFRRKKQGPHFCDDAGLFYCKVFK